MPSVDVGIPQLLILSSESLTAGDRVSATDFVSRAIGKLDATPYLRSEALRYQGRFSFFTNAPDAARLAFEEAILQLGDLPSSLAAKAFLIADLLVVEFMFGDCAQVPLILERFVRLLAGNGIAVNVRRQLTSNVASEHPSAARHAEVLGERQSDLPWQHQARLCPPA